MKGRRRLAVDACDGGQISVLILGLALIALSLVLAAVNVTATQLARARLYDVADAVSLDAADALSEASVYLRGVGAVVPVEDATVSAAAQRSLAARPRPDQVASWRLEAGTGSPDGRSARIVLTGTVQMPLAHGLIAAIAGPVTVTVDSRAEARVRLGVP